MICLCSFNIELIRIYSISDNKRFSAFKYDESTVNDGDERTTWTGDRPDPWSSLHQSNNGEDRWLGYWGTTISNTNLPGNSVWFARKRQFPFVLICRIISLEGCFRYPSVLSTVCVGVFDMIIQFLCMLPAYSLKYNILWWTSSSILSGNFFFGTSISISLICVWSH